MWVVILYSLWCIGIPVCGWFVIICNDHIWFFAWLSIIYLLNDNPSKAVWLTSYVKYYMIILICSHIFHIILSRTLFICCALRYSYDLYMTNHHSHLNECFHQHTHMPEVSLSEILILSIEHEKWVKANDWLWLILVLFNSSTPSTYCVVFWIVVKWHATCILSLLN